MNDAVEYYSPGRRRDDRRIRVTFAEVAELADAHGSGPCTRKGVGVRVPSSAPLLKKICRISIMGGSSFDRPRRLFQYRCQGNAAPGMRIGSCCVAGRE